ncbi:MAG: hypothetical protein ACJARP_002338, partial [Vicingaceae bacterium]
TKRLQKVLQAQLILERSTRVFPQMKYTIEKRMKLLFC